VNGGAYGGGRKSPSEDGRNLQTVISEKRGEEQNVIFEAEIPEKFVAHRSPTTSSFINSNLRKIKKEIKLILEA